MAVTDTALQIHGAKNIFIKDTLFLHLSACFPCFRTRNRDVSTLPPPTKWKSRSKFLFIFSKKIFVRDHSPLSRLIERDKCPFSPTDIRRLSPSARFPSIILYEVSRIAATPRARVKDSPPMLKTILLRQREYRAANLPDTKKTGWIPFRIQPVRLWRMGKTPRRAQSAFSVNPP